MSCLICFAYALGGIVILAFLVIVAMTISINWGRN